MSFHLRGEELLLNQSSIFEEFLDDVIAEHIRHHFFRVNHDFFENLLFVVAVRTRNLLLKESRALLVTSKVCYIAEGILSSL